MVGEDTFYESAEVHDKRFLDLVHEVTRNAPDFIGGAAVVDEPSPHTKGLAAYLRSDLLMRSAPVVMACEYVRAGGPHGRHVVNMVCQRPDEPAEVLGYWLSRYGRRVPWPVKRGVADAVVRLYNERAALRYDGQSRGMRMGDVLELAHPTPKDDRQAALFKYLLDQRHHGDGMSRLPVTPDAYLPALAADGVLRATPPERRRSLLGSPWLEAAGWPWERLAGWLPGGMDAEAWSSVIPNMGVMALLRNLRNFDQAGLPDAAVDRVIAQITDEDEVRKARVFPFHAWLAYREAPSDNWKRALGKTLDLATRNIPDALDGSLVVIDCSGSMEGSMSGKSTLRRWEVAAVLGAAIAHGTKDSNVVIFGAQNKDVTQPAGSSALRTVERVARAVQIGEVGHSTLGHTAVRDHWDPTRHKRVFIVTDDQQHDSGRVRLDHVPLVYTVNVGGYASSSMESGRDGRHTLAGFGDAQFRLVPAIEAGRDARWEF